jgi:hypothetical protein
MTLGGSAFILGASLAAINVIFVAITAVVARMMGLGIAEIKLLTGPTLVSFHVGGTKIAIKPLPIGSGIAFRGERGADEESPAATADRFRAIDDLNDWQRMLLALSTPVGFLLIALALGGGSAIAHAATALQDIYLGAFRPSTTGVALLQRYIEAWREAPSAALGILAAKYGVYLLVPTAGSPGFAAAVALMKSAFGYEMPSDFNMLVALPLIVPPFIVLGGWTLAMFWFLYPLLDSAI